MYACESWTIKKVERRRIDAFELWCWRVPWTARRSNQSILKEINPEYSLEGLMLNLKLQYFGYLMHRTETHWKRLQCWGKWKAGGEGDDRGWDGWMTSPTQWTWVCVSSGSWWWTGKPGVLQSMGSQRVGQDWVIELNRWGHSLYMMQVLLGQVYVHSGTWEQCLFKTRGLFPQSCPCLGWRHRFPSPSWAGHCTSLSGPLWVCFFFSEIFLYFLFFYIEFFFKV